MHKYVFKPTLIFLEQKSKLSLESKKLIEEKLLLIEQNPFRFKKLKFPNLFIFRIRFSDNKAEKRLIYLLRGNEIILLYISNRKDDYKDLEKYLKATKLI